MRIGWSYTALSIGVGIGVSIFVRVSWNVLYTATASTKLCLQRVNCESRHRLPHEMTHTLFSVTDSDNECDRQCYDFQLCQLDFVCFVFSEGPALRIVSSRSKSSKTVNCVSGYVFHTSPPGKSCCCCQSHCLPPLMATAWTVFLGLSCFNMPRLCKTPPVHTYFHWSFKVQNITDSPSQSQASVQSPIINR